VLVTGETGLAKNLSTEPSTAVPVAPHVAFVSVNCAAIPARFDRLRIVLDMRRALVTGAAQRRLGRFEWRRVARSSSMKLESFADGDADRAVACIAGNMKLSVSAERSPSQQMCE